MLNQCPGFNISFLLFSFCYRAVKQCIPAWEWSNIDKMILKILKGNLSLIAEQSI